MKIVVKLSCIQFQWIKRIMLSFVEEILTFASISCLSKNPILVKKNLKHICFKVSLLKIGFQPELFKEPWMFNEHIFHLSEIELF